MTALQHTRDSDSIAGYDAELNILESCLEATRKNILELDKYSAEGDKYSTNGHSGGNSREEDYNKGQN